MAWQAALIAAQLWLGEITRPRPKRGTFEDLLAANKGDETRPIPYVRGRWKTTPQRIWLGDFSARAVERDSHWTDYLWAGVWAGLLDFITVSYRYYCGQAFALTWGPINRVHQVYVQDLPCAVAPLFDNAGGTLLLDDPQLFGGDQPPGLGGIYAICDVLSGSYTQTRNAYLQSVESNVPGLHGVAALVVQGRSGATESGYFAAGPAESMQLREWKVELMAWPDVLGTSNAQLPDQSFNRIHALYEWATNADFGAQYPVASIHFPSWRAAAQTVYDEGNGFSGEINVGGRVQDVFDQLKASVDAEVYEHPRDGLKLKLIRKDYTIPTLPILSEANTNSIEEYTPGDYADSFNRVTLNFINADNNYQPRPAVYEDPANFHIQERVASKQLEYPGVASASLAQKLVTQAGRALSQPLPPLILSAGSVGESLWPGDLYNFHWTDPFVRKVMRVHARTPGVSYDGERQFRLTATEDQYSVGLSVFGAPSDTDASNPADIWDTAPPSAAFDDTLLPPDGLEYVLQVGISGTLQSMIHGAIIFGTYEGGQYARLYVTEPGGVQTLSPIRLSPDADDKAEFTWPAGTAGVYQFCVQTFSVMTGATNGVKVCATTAAASFSVSPSASQSPSSSASPSVSPSTSQSPSSSESPSISPSSSVSPSVSPSGSQSPSSSPSPSVSASVSPSSSQSPSGSQSPSASVSPSASTSPSSSASPSGPSFPSIASIWAWWEPDLEGVSNGAEFNGLVDQSGNGRHMTNTAPAGQVPICLANNLNGADVAEHVGTVGAYFTLPNMSALTASHVFKVIKAAADPAPSGSGDEGYYHRNCTAGSPNSHYPYSDGNLYEGWGSTSRMTVGNPTPSLAAWRVYEIISTSSEFTVLLDGTQLNTTGSNAVGFPNSTTPWGRNDGTGQYWKGWMAGIYQFSAKITGTDRSNLISYINSRFGLSVS